MLKAMRETRVLSDPLGRRLIRKSLEVLKINTCRELTHFNRFHEWVQNRTGEIEESLVIGNPEVSDFLSSQVVSYLREVKDLINSFSLYIDSLESYLSELDESFSSVLEKANNTTEQRIRESPKDISPFYS